MSYIAPNSKIYFLKGVPLDPTYDHTVYWASASAQYNWFYSHRKPTASGIVYALEAQTYQRVNKGIISCGICADNLYDCNYLMFQNTSFGAKWFYAFITSVEYVNNTVSNVTFEIDVMQTWFFEYELEDCFVEREHSARDNLFENTLEEKIDCGSFVISEMNRPTAIIEGIQNPVSILDTMVVVIAASAGENAQGTAIVDTTGGMYNGVYSGLNCMAFPAEQQNSATIINTWLQRFIDANKSDSIVSIFMMPQAFYQNPQDGYTPPKEYNITFPANLTTQYTVRGETKQIKNKKLLCYPYNCFFVTSSSGENAVYRYEFFNMVNNEINFVIRGSSGVICEIEIAPKNYLGAAENSNEAIKYSDFPQCSWNIDTFKAWLAQHKPGLSLVASGVLGGLSEGVTGALTGNPILISEGTKLAGDAAKKAGEFLFEGVQSYRAPDRNKGKDYSTIDIAKRRVGFRFYNQRIRGEYIEIIDSYFDRFGYKTNLTKKPNRSARPCWNYVKTTDCTIKASIPSEDVKTICEIYNKGITFWHTTRIIGGSEVSVEIGDYSQDNSPV